MELVRQILARVITGKDDIFNNNTLFSNAHAQTVKDDIFNKQNFFFCLQCACAGGGSRVGGADGERFPVLGARLCMEIIEREQQETFLESLINICQVLLFYLFTM